MHGLVLLMVRARPADAGQDVETDLVVRFRVFDLGARGREFRRRVVTGLGVVERPGRLAAEEVGFEAGIEDAAVEAEGGVEGGAHVADFLQFAPDGAGAQGVFVVVEEDGGAVGVGGQGGVGGLGG